ncbi:MAG: hypothetical protein DVB29_02840 [Verrucomicrobia bacterium]|nr:MAG: hypothetical protein DVB29_02840 [Verrucomicrobiota bacterium]MDH4469453.1 hypothetical protein [Verrucomicrobiae bacterium]
MTRSLPLVSPFQGCLLKPGQSPPRSPDRRWCLYQDSRRLAMNQYEVGGLRNSTVPGITVEANA